MALHASQSQPRRHERGALRHEDTPPHEQPWHRRALDLPLSGPLAPHVDHFLTISDYKPVTVYSYKRVLSALVSKYPDQTARDYTPLQLSAFISQRTAGKAPSTKKNVTVIIRSFFQWLQAVGVLDRNPAIGLKTPTVKPPEPRFLDEQDIHNLLRAAHRDLAFQSVIALAAYAGMRRGSIHALKWKDVDLEGRTVTIRNAKGGKHYIVPMAPQLRTILQVWQDASRSNDCGYVYAHEWKGHWRPFYYSSTIKRFHKYARVAGLSEDAGLHDLRRTFATTLHNKGVDITVISRLLGHASVQTTMNHYAFTSDRLKMEAVLSLNY